MRIIVCVKQVPSTNEVRIDPVTHTILREGTEAILNPFDEYAVEEALRLRARYGAELTAVSMGIPAAEAVLREAIALGFDRAVLLSDRAFAGADTLATAHALAAGIKTLGLPDLILCGRMATDGDTAQVGPMIAELLGIAHVTDVSAIESILDGVLCCRRLTDDGYASVRARLPALITVAKEINVPRLPSIAGMLRGHAAKVPVWSHADIGAAPAAIGLMGSPTQVVSTFVPARSRDSRRLAGSREILEVLSQKRVLEGEVHA